MIFPFRDNIPLRRTPVVTYALIAINFAVALYDVRLPAERQQQFAYEHGFIPARMAQLGHGRAIEVHVPRHRDRDGRVVEHTFDLSPDPLPIFATFLTTMFIHGSWFHLLSNMWYLWIFGDNVEDRLGRLPFLCFYISGGLLASLCHWWHDPRSMLPVVGASGAIAAVLGAYAVTFPWARIRSIVFVIIFFTIFELPALLVLGVWFLTQLVQANQDGMQLGMGGVAWWAHIGGFVAGAIIMPLIRDDPSEPEYAESYIEPGIEPLAEAGP
jgi:membrane associated rhomboid family serine protease